MRRIKSAKIIFLSLSEGYSVEGLDSKSIIPIFFIAVELGKLNSLRRIARSLFRASPPSSVLSEPLD